MGCVWRMAHRLAKGLKLHIAENQNQAKIIKLQCVYKPLEAR